MQKPAGIPASAYSQICFDDYPGSLILGGLVLKTCVLETMNQNTAFFSFFDTKCCIIMQVLEGYVYLGNVASLGEEVMAAFAAVVGAAALKVARGVVLTRPVPGLEERVKSTQLLQELVKWLPPDLFRTCLTRVVPFLSILCLSGMCMKATRTAETNIYESQACLLEGIGICCSW